MNTAIIDLGTNTFNLLVAHIGPNGHWSIEFANSIPVFLAKNAGDHQEIQPDRIVRAMDAVHIHINNALNYDCKKFILTGTAMLRKASNAPQLIENVRKRFGHQIMVIDGMTEANLIFAGIDLLMPHDGNTRLLMDIGGGSVEFLIFRDGAVLWKNSYELGVGRLMTQLEFSDPLSADDVRQIQQAFDNATTDFQEALKTFRPAELVGSAGSFDSISAIVSAFRNSFDLGTIKRISIEEFQKVNRLMLTKTAAERTQINGMEPTRIQTLPIACTLIEHVLQLSKIKKINRAAFALREGIADSIAAGTFDAMIHSNN